MEGSQGCRGGGAGKMSRERVKARAEERRESQCEEEGAGRRQGEEGLLAGSGQAAKTGRASERRGRWLRPGGGPQQTEGRGGAPSSRVFFHFARRSRTGGAGAQRRPANGAWGSALGTMSMSLAPMRERCHTPPSANSSRAAGRPRRFDFITPPPLAESHAPTFAVPAVPA